MLYRTLLFMTVAVTLVDVVVRAVEDLNANTASSSAPAASCPGDFNGDGTVSLADFLAFAGAFGARSGDANFNALMDLDASGAIGLSDFLAFAGVFGTTCDASPPVTVPDANLRAVIEDSLGKASGAPITAAEMAGLRRLEAPNKDISDLTGLEFATGLTRLDLGAAYVDGEGYVNSNNISSLSPLSGLTTLERLSLNNTNVTDLSPLSELTNLERLSLDNTNVTDLSALSGLTSLEYLNLYDTDISNVSPLSGLANLNWLNLGNNNAVSDVSPLSGLTNLEWLTLSFTSVTDLSALSGLNSLEYLNLYQSKATDLTPLSGLTNLEWLALTRNNVTDLSALSGLTRLEYLNLGYNNISGLSPLAGLTSLQEMFLEGNQITDVSALSGLTNLRTLRLEYNRISDLAPLVANTGLGSGDEVDVRGNPLSAASLNAHVSALKTRGVRVSFDETVVFTDPRIYQDNVFVLPVSENLAAGDLPLDDFTTRFYGHFSDTFDFLIFFSSLSRSQLDREAFKGAYYAGAGNDVQGIGKGIFFDDRWGSAGKLQGGLFFAHVDGWTGGHSRLVEGPMLHELMHRWANFIVEPAVPHWDFTSANGILGGFDNSALVDHGGGRYSAPDVYTGGWAANLKPYSPIELYLAGLIPPDEVPDLRVAEDGEILRDASGRWDGRSFTADRVKTNTIQDIIAEHGPRVPDHTQSQKAFRAAVILLVSEDYPATHKFLETLSNDASLFSHAGEDQHDEWYNFYEATGGRATISMDGLSRFTSSTGAKRPAVRSFGTPPPPILCDLH